MSIVLILFRISKANVKSKIIILRGTNIMPSTRAKVKTLIQLSRTPAEADEAIRENFGFKSCKEKIAFLMGMFDELPSADPYTPDEFVYGRMLRSIIEASHSSK